MVYLLLDEDYFAIEVNFIGRTSSMILFWGFLAAILYGPIGGWLYDRFLRKWPIFFSAILGSFMLMVFPLTSPSIAWLTLVRVIA